LQVLLSSRWRSRLFVFAFCVALAQRWAVRLGYRRFLVSSILEAMFMDRMLSWKGAFMSYACVFTETRCSTVVPQRLTGHPDDDPGMYMSIYWPIVVVMHPNNGCAKVYSAATGEQLQSYERTACVVSKSGIRSIQPCRVGASCALPQSHVAVGPFRNFLASLKTLKCTRFY
jgi:hypothetical protein